MEQLTMQDIKNQREWEDRYWMLTCLIMFELIFQVHCLIEYYQQLCQGSIFYAFKDEEHELQRYRLASVKSNCKAKTNTQVLISNRFLSWYTTVIFCAQHYSNGWIKDDIFNFACVSPLPATTLSPIPTTWWSQSGLPCSYLTLPIAWRLRQGQALDLRGLSQCLTSGPLLVGPCQ